MALISTNRENARSGAVGIGEPRWARVVLITVVLLFLGVFLFLPLIVVFTEAFKKGAALYLESIIEPDALSAIQLTLIAAGLAVPLARASRPCSSQTTRSDGSGPTFGSARRAGGVAARRRSGR